MLIHELKYCCFLFVFRFFYIFDFLWFHECFFTLLNELKNDAVILFNVNDLFSVSFIVIFVASDEHHWFVSIHVHIESQFVDVIIFYHVIRDDVIYRFLLTHVSFDEVISEDFIQATILHFCFNVNIKSVVEVKKSININFVENIEIRFWKCLKNRKKCF